jgi:hypothetical protein
MATAHAARAYAPSVLAALSDEQRLALDRFAARALDDPGAAPADGAESEAVDAADRLARQAALRLLRGHRSQHQEAL